MVAIRNAQLFEALRASEERYRAATELASDYAYAFRVEANGTFMLEWVTEAFTRITGYRSEDIDGRGGWVSFTYSEDLPIALRHMQALLSGQRSVSEFRIVTKTDEIRWVREISRPVWEEARQRTIRIYGAAQDITERKRAEESLRRRAMELEALAEVSAALRSARTVDEMLPIFLHKGIEMVGASAGAIYLVEPETGDLVSRGWSPANMALSGQRLKRGEGITGRVAISGQPYVSKDMHSDPLVQFLPGETAHLDAMRSSIALPLHTQEGLVGVMHIALRQRRDFTEAEVRLLTALAEMAGNSLHRAALHEQTERRMQRLAALRAIDLAITTNLDIQVTLDVLLEQSRAQLGVDATCILIFNPQTQTLDFAAGIGFHSQGIKQMRLSLGEGIAGRAAEQRILIAMNDLPSALDETMRAPIWLEENFASRYSVPLISGGQVKGVLEAFHRTPLRPDKEWLDFLETLAGQAAIAIENTQLFDNLQSSNRELAAAYDATIEGWARAIELRDEGTEGHSRRVTDMTLRLAQASGITAEELVHIRRGALLHDIGKMAVPDAVLFKPGPLDENELAIIRRHPIAAFEMLSPIEFLKPALEIPYCHHEKWDGTGYPRGLRGESIPLSARLFAIVDVWDALRSDRPYRRGWSEEKVRDHIRQLAGSHFDPSAVEIFLHLPPLSFDQA